MRRQRNLNRITRSYTWDWKRQTLRLVHMVSFIWPAAKYKSYNQREESKARWHRHCLICLIAVMIALSRMLIPQLARNLARDMFMPYEPICCAPPNRTMTPG